MGLRLFVTSSGTEIGKTFVTAALVHQLRNAGKQTAAYKPLLSGFDADDPGASDTGILLSALGRNISPENIDALTPWRFTPALSPDMAAAREGREIVFDDVADFTARAFAGPEEAVLVEGVGGVMAPIGSAHTVLDWIAQARVPALLVVGGYLGTISHTLTAARALEAADVPLGGIVISARGELPVPPEETAATIDRFLPGVPVAVVPDLGEGASRWRETPDLLGPLGLTHTAA